MRVKDNVTMNLPYQSQRYKWPDKKVFNIEPFSSWCVSNAMGFDIETKGLDPFKHNVYILSFAVSPEDKCAGVYYLQPCSDKDINYTDNESLLLLKSIIENPKVTLIGHNIKFDLKWLLVKYGWTLRCKVFDTMLASYLIDENLPASLEDCIERFLYEETHKGMVLRKDLEQEHINDVLLYNAYDAETVKRVAVPQMKMLQELGMDKLAKIAMQVIPVLTKMEVRGICIDKPYAKKIEARLIQEATKLRVDISKSGYGVFDPDSPKDLARILYNVIGFEVPKYTDKGNPSTDYEALLELKGQGKKDSKVNTFLNNITEYKGKIKLLSTYYQPIDKWLAYDNRRHARYSLGKDYDAGGGTVTGRLSGDMQQLPRDKELRGMHIPTEGYSFIDGDFSQIELRVGAWLSNERGMIDAFESGKDIHTAVMSEIEGIPYDELVGILKSGSNEKLKNARVAYKAVNFGIFYGMTSARLQQTLKLDANMDVTLEWCDEYIEKWKARYPSAIKWIEQSHKIVQRDGFITMPFGQRRRLPDARLIIPKWYQGITNEEKEIRKQIRLRKSRAERQATNFVVQSMASWIMLMGLVLVDKHFQLHPEYDGHCVLQVHDSGTWEVINTSNVEQAKKEVQHIMEQGTIDLMEEHFGIIFNVPLKFETKILNRWE